MAIHLQDEIRQTRPFASPQQEAHLSLGRTWAVLEHDFSEALKPHGITPTQYNVLRILRGAGHAGLCRNGVMQRMISSVPDATRLLDRMETAELIARQRDAIDRRFVTTRITDAGRELLARLEEPVLELHQRHFGALQEDELRELIGYLARVRQAV